MRRSVSFLLILVAALAVAACRPEGARATLVGRFSDSSVTLKSKITLPSGGESYHLLYALRQGGLSCALTADLLDSDVPDSSHCAGHKGTGVISCNDGRKLPLIWALTSCKSGFGWSLPSTGPRFVFGFNRDPDRALDQLLKADNAE